MRCMTTRLYCRKNQRVTLSVLVHGRAFAVCGYAAEEKPSQNDEGERMIELSHWPYIQTISLSGDYKTDITNFLTVNGKQDTASHCISVAKTSEEIAVRFGVDKSMASASALLHDISNVVKPQDMLDYAIKCNWEIDASERKYPFILHQRLSADFARELFGITDPLILSAIRCHSTLKENPSAHDMVLFLADKLSWDQDGTPPFYDAISSALERSLAHASLAYINFVLDNGMILSPHRWLLDAKKWLENQSDFLSVPS